VKLSMRRVMPTGYPIAPHRTRRSPPGPPQAVP
jgi:hypothetical protein